MFNCFCELASVRKYVVAKKYVFIWMLWMKSVYDVTCRSPSQQERMKRYISLQTVRSLSLITSVRNSSKCTIRWWCTYTRSCGPSEVLANYSRTTSLRNTEIGIKSPTPCSIKRTSFKVKSSWSSVQLMLRSKVCNIFWKGRPTNFKLGTQM